MSFNNYQNIGYSTGRFSSFSNFGLDTSSDSDLEPVQESLTGKRGAYDNYNIAWKTAYANAKSSASIQGLESASSQAVKDLEKLDDEIQKKALKDGKFNRKGVEKDEIIKAMEKIGEIVKTLEETGKKLADAEAAKDKTYSSSVSIYDEAVELLDSAREKTKKADQVRAEAKAAEEARKKEEADKKSKEDEADKEKDKEWKGSFAKSLDINLEDYGDGDNIVEYDSKKKDTKNPLVGKVQDKIIEMFKDKLEGKSAVFDKFMSYKGDGYFGPSTETVIKGLKAGFGLDDKTGNITKELINKLALSTPVDKRTVEEKKEESKESSTKK